MDPNTPNRPLVNTGWRDIYWIDAPPPGRLAILSRPRAGDGLADQIAGWRAAGIETAVSLLETEEARDLDLGRVALLCAGQAIDFVSFPIADRGVPTSRRDTITLARILADRIAAGGSVAVHCRAGVGRSALMAATILVLLGRDPAAAFDSIAAARGVPVPDTDEQRDWVHGVTVL